MKSALLLYRKLVADLTSIGFIINTYDQWVANKMIKRKQMTIRWHVDDLFIGHADPIVVTQLLTWLSQCYDTAEKKLSVTQGPHHNYLSIYINFSTDGTVTFDIIPNITKIFAAFPEKNTGVSSTPVVDHLFNVCSAQPSLCR